jgi:hypothetical protein
MIARIVLAAFLMAHGAIHVGFVSPRPPVTAGGPAWPFDLGRSWILAPLGIGPDVTRLVGLALVAATISGFAVAAAAALGVLPASLWPAGLSLGAVASLALLLVFFHPWLLLGIAIDLALLWAVLMADWTPDGVAV